MKYWALCACAVLMVICPRATATVNVTLSGVKGEVADNVRAYLSVASVSAGSTERAALTPFAVARLHGKAEEEIRRALMPFGFYTPQIDTALTRTDEGWEATYHIDPGEPVTVAELDIRLDPEVAATINSGALMARSTLVIGKPLSHRAYTALKQQLLSATLAAGYLDARYETARLEVFPERLEAVVRLTLDAGQRFYFGDITLSQEAVDQSFAERFITLTRDEPFSTERLVKTQFALSDSGYFRDVTVSAPRARATNHRIPVHIDAKSRKAQRLTARIGFGTDTGPRVRLGTEFRRLNGRGNQFRSDLQVSAIRTTANSQYAIPIKNVATDRQTFSGRFERAEIGDTDSDLYSLGARRYDRWRDLRRQLYVEFENELFSLGQVSETRSELLIFGASLAYQNVDDALFTRRGMTARFEVQGSHSSLLSDTSFVQATFAARVVMPLGQRGRLLLRSDLGVTEVSDLNRLPPSQRFFTGGDRTVRGYGFEELSPEDADGNDIGGRYLLTASVEADYFFNDKYGIAAFFDHGNAVNQLQDALKSGVGIGFRYRTPIGVLRIDGARPLDQVDDDFRFHISLGPDT